MYIREIIGYKLRDILVPYQQGNMIAHDYLKSIEINNNKINVVLRANPEKTNYQKELRSIIEKRLQDLQDHFKIDIRYDC